jgi:hypothetical protein
MRRGQWIGIGLGVLCVVAVVLWLASSGNGSGAGNGTGDGDGFGLGDGDGTGGGDGTGDGPEDEAGAPDDPRVRANDPEVRALAEELRERIERARERRESEEERLVAEGGRSPVETGGSAVNSEEVPRGSLDPQYIRDAVRAVQPLIAECYELALHEDQSLEGRLVVEFDIEGEADAGGVVERTSINEDSTLHHEILDECVAQTLYTLELPAPEGGGMVHVRYPFGFSNAPDDEQGSQ